MSFPVEKIGAGVWRAKDEAQQGAIAEADGLQVGDECITGGALFRCVNASTTPSQWERASSGWETLLDLDFAAEPTQDLSAGGSFTIAGLGFEAVNATSASTFQLLNGTGVEIAHNAGNRTYNNASKLAPMLQLKIQDVAADFTVDEDLRVMVQFAATGLSAVWEYAFAAVDLLPTTGTPHRSLIQYYGRGATLNPSWLVRLGTPGGDKWGETGHDLADDVMIMTLKSDATIGGWYSGTYASGWPVDIHRHGQQTFDMSSVVDTWQSDNVGVVFGTTNFNNGGTTGKITVKRLRIDRVPSGR